MTVGIYKIRNICNGKIYVGQSKSIERRMKVHINTAHNKKKEAYEYHLYRSIRKYGLSNFEFTILERCSIESLNEREKYWISHFESNKKGFNSTGGGTDNHFQSLDFEKLDMITIDLAQGLLTDKEIGAKYGVSRQMINNINKGKCWIRAIEYPIRKGKINMNGVLINVDDMPKNHCKVCGCEIDVKSTHCKYCYAVHLRTTWPSPAELQEELCRSNFVRAATKYGVTDNAVRKWCRAYGMSDKSKDYR